MIEPFPEPIAGYAAPQERFERIRERAFRRFGPRLCDLAYANAYDGPAPVVVEAIRRALDNSAGLDLQYTPYGGATVTRRLIARHIGTMRNRPLPWRHVVMTPGAMAGLSILFRAVRREGVENEAIVVTPCWLDCPLYLAHLGIQPRLVPSHRASLGLDLDAIRSALNERTRAVVLSQPNNPSGLLYSARELEDLARILHGHPARPLLVSDECHRDILFGEADFVSPAEFYDATCVVYSFGKAWFMQGQRIGYVAVSPAMPDATAFAERLAILCRVMGYCTPTALMQLAVRDLLDCRPSLDKVRDRRERAIAALSKAGYPLVRPQATFFLYPEVPAGEDDFAFAERMAERGVLVLPSSLFHDRGHFRISVTATDAPLERALSILAEARLSGAAA